MTEHGNPTAPGGTATLGTHTVARVGYGVMQLAERHVPQDEAVALLRLAVELGVDHLDTAAFYGHDRANTLIHDALHPYADGVVIATKVGAERAADGALVPAQRPEQLRAGVEANLRTLGLDRLAVVNLRRLDAGPGIVAEGEQRVPLDDQLAELIALRDAGLIEGIGLSQVSEAQLRQALPAGIVTVQNLYNLLERDTEPELSACREQGLAWVPFFPVGSGFPGRPRPTEAPEVRAAAERLGATPVQVALAWLLDHAPNVLLIPGTSSPGHLRENVAAGSVRLDAQARAELDALAPARG